MLSEKYARKTLHSNNFYVKIIISASKILCFKYHVRFFSSRFWEQSLTTYVLLIQHQKTSEITCISQIFQGKCISGKRKFDETLSVALFFLMVNLILTLVHRPRFKNLLNDTIQAFLMKRVTSGKESECIFDHLLLLQTFFIHEQKSFNESVKPVKKRLRIIRVRPCPQDVIFL